VTPEAEKLILAMVYRPGDVSGGDPEAVLRYFGTDDGVALGRRLLREAIERQDATDFELALIVCGRFAAIDESLMPLFIEQSYADWHTRHEDLVSILGKYKSPETVDALYHATQWIPEYLDYDEARALAHKAIWALGGTPGPEATAALTRLLTDEDETLHEAAAKQLRRRGEPVA
jgi:hypothetical protein